MKIKSHLLFNTSLVARHAPSVQEGKVIIGGSSLEQCVIPAGSTLEIADAEWLKFEPASESLVKSGALEVLVAPKKTLEEQAASDLAELEAIDARAMELKAKLKAAEPAPKKAKAKKEEVK